MIWPVPVEEICETGNVPLLREPPLLGERPPRTDRDLVGTESAHTGVQVLACPRDGRALMAASHCTSKLETKDGRDCWYAQVLGAETQALVDSPWEKTQSSCTETARRA